MVPIDTSAYVLQASWVSTARPTLMNACQAPVFTGGVLMEWMCITASVNGDGLVPDVKLTLIGKNCDIDIDVCLETPTNVSLCLNGGTCLDGEGSNFTCSCPAGFIGDFCEMDVNECCSDPCWTGLHCELDINECLPQPCNQGMCIQNQPGYGYTCFCRPGFVGKNCEHNYDDCLLQPCPGGYSCVDGINKVSCQPAEGDMSSVPWEPSITQTPWGSLLTTSPVSPYSEQPTGMEVNRKTTVV
ncbi:unnamed protein product [Coregonus sp. 'balchen']|nr:unnamed protein product [Coregonus sp. 'balchen']